jgi:hypothetical protein
MTDEHRSPDKALAAAMRAIPMVGDGAAYRQRLDDFVKGYRTARAPAPVSHGKECADEDARDVCEDVYADRTNEVLGLVEALHAIAGLCAGHSEQSKAITKIIEDSIEEHAAWTR